MRSDTIQNGRQEMFRRSGNVTRLAGATEKTDDDRSFSSSGGRIGATGEAASPPKEYKLRLTTVVGQAPGFLWRSLLGGIDVAFRAFHPRLPISPAWLVYPVRLSPGTPRVLQRPLCFLASDLRDAAHGRVAPL